LRLEKLKCIELVTNGGNTLSTVIGDEKVEELARHYFAMCLTRIAFFQSYAI